MKGGILQNGMEKAVEKKSETAPFGESNPKGMQHPRAAGVLSLVHPPLMID
jgi:hypothetical protein